jgi:hypothetical protein
MFCPHYDSDLSHALQASVLPQPSAIPRLPRGDVNRHNRKSLVGRKLHREDARKGKMLQARPRSLSMPCLAEMAMKTNLRSKEDAGQAPGLGVVAEAHG